MRFFAGDGPELPLPPAHPFPAAKYGLLRRAVLRAGLGDVLDHEPASDAELGRAHEPAYVSRVDAGGLTAAEQRRLGFPWSPELAWRARSSVGGTVAACRAALDDGVAMHLAGGTHHARADRGAGYCVYNDAVVAARAVQAEGRRARVVVVDCDAHQGDGTAALAAADDALFTFSIHGARSFPYHKEPSDLDVALADGTGDEAYLAALSAGLDEALGRARADLAIYLAGADPFAGDRWGRLGLTMAGLARRDRMVLEACRAAGLPVAVAIAGGYARRVEDVVAIHLQTARIAREAAG